MQSDPIFLIMTSLAGGPKHGYAMMEDIEAFAGTRLGAGTLYGAISRLEESGWIESLRANDRRRPYRLTPSGEHEWREQCNRLQSLAVSAGARLREEPV